MVTILVAEAEVIEATVEAAEAESGITPATVEGIVPSARAPVPHGMAEPSAWTAFAGGVTCGEGISFRSRDLRGARTNSASGRSDREPSGPLRVETSLRELWAAFAECQPCSA